MYERKSMSAIDNTAIPTGFSCLDDWNIFERGKVLLLAEPLYSSALCNSIALKVAKEPNFCVLYFLTAGDKVSHAGRLLCADALVDPGMMRVGFATEEMRKRVADSAKELASSNIYIDDRFAISLDEIEERLKELSKDCDVNLVLVDGLETLNRQNSKNMKEEWNQIGIRLKKMAKKFNCVVVLRQSIQVIYEENDTDFKWKEPKLTQLIEYKELIREIDVVMFTYRESSEDGIELIVALNSSGTCGHIYFGHINGCDRVFDLRNMPSAPGI